MTLHLVALPHTETVRDAYVDCAYTQKTRRLADMLTGAGFDVRLYAGEANDAACKEHICCLTRAEQTDRFGAGVPPFDAHHPGWALFATRAVAEIGERAAPGDMLLLTAGQAQAPIAAAHPTLTIVEPGVGYGGVLPDSFRCFESQAWMHTVHGALSYGDAHSIDGRFYDTVIPNSYDPGDFPGGDGQGGYLLYVGRLIERKGLQVVADIAKHTGLPLIVAGDGDRNLIPPGAEYVGVVGPERRAELMGDAIALLAPTLYLEPFGGVAVEAQMTGTPVIATPWGAFTETVEHGVTGFRCHTLAAFLAAVDDAPHLDRQTIRQRAVRLYSTDTAAGAYSAWFDQLATLTGDGWYTTT